MSDEFGNDIITLIDEDGEEAEYEHIDTLEYNGETYFALIKLESTAEDVLSEENLLVILKLITDENGEELLTTIEDDDEYDTVAAQFEESLTDFYEIEH